MWKRSHPLQCGVNFGVKLKDFSIPMGPPKVVHAEPPLPPGEGMVSGQDFKDNFVPLISVQAFFLYKSQSVHNNIFLSVWQGNIFQPCILGRAENQLLAMALVMPLLMAGLPASTARSGFFLTQPNR